MGGMVEAEHTQEEKAVSGAETLRKPRGGESLVVVRKAEKEEDGGRRTVGLCGAPKVFWASRCSRVLRQSGLHLGDTHCTERVLTVVTHHDSGC